MPPTQASILHLNNDCLAQIIQTIAHDQRPRPPGPQPPEPSSPLKAFSVTCKRLRDLSSPELFRSVKLGKWQWTWQNHHEALLSMERCSAAKRYTQRFTMSLSTGQKDSDAPPTRELVVKLVDVLKGMEKLHMLSFTAFRPVEDHIDLIRLELEDLPLRLPTTKTLSIPCSMDFFIPFFPSLENLTIDVAPGSAETPISGIRQSSSLDLKSFEAKAQWSTPLLQTLHSTSPNLTTLAILPSRPQYAEKFYNLLPSIAAFTKLRSLTIASLSYLRVGFQAPGCGNAYMGPGGAELRRKVNARAEKLQREVAEMVFGRCRGLEELWIGDTVRVRKGEGKEEGSEVVELKMGREKRGKMGELVGGRCLY